MELLPSSSTLSVGWAFTGPVSAGLGVGFTVVASLVAGRLWIAAALRVRGRGTAGNLAFGKGWFCLAFDGVQLYSKSTIY